MNRKIALLGSVSAVALAAGANAAHAQEMLTPDGFTFTIEGGALFGNNTVAEDKLGSAVSAGNADLDIQDNLGYRAAISTGKQIDPHWDIRGALAINQQLLSTSTFEFSGGVGPFDDGYGTIDTKFDYETLDFEVGYRPMANQDVDLRLFGGVRGLHYNDSLDKLGTYDSGGLGSGGYVEYGYKSEFVGAGPRLGVEASTRLGDSNFGVSGMLAGAAMYGTRRTSGDAVIFSGGSGGAVPFPGSEEQTIIYNLEAALGLDLHVDDATKLTFGYRAEGLFGVENGTSGGPFSSGGDGTRWTHGPTIKLTGYLD